MITLTIQVRLWLLIHNLNKREYYIMKQGTICVQGAYRPKNGEPRVLPIVQSTTYKYDSSVEMGDLFDLKKSGYFYSRLQNPTNDTVAAKITMLEGGVAGMLTSSGQAANFYAVFNIAQAGDHIVSSSAISYSSSLGALPCRCY